MKLTGHRPKMGPKSPKQATRRLVTLKLQNAVAQKVAPGLKVINNRKP